MNKSLYRALMGLLAILCLSGCFIQKPQEPVIAESPIPAVSVSPSPAETPAVTLTPSLTEEPQPVVIQTPEPSLTPTVTPEITSDPAVTPEITEIPPPSPDVIETEAIPEDETCDDKACVALYIYTYKHLPSNFVTKKQARKMGWKSGSLSRVKKGLAIGGDVYGNYEGKLPEQYKYRECDLNTVGRKKRKTERLVYSEDCELVYYTDDHYQTFELLYGEE